jgi:hypothetical protein
MVQSPQHVKYFRLQKHYCIILIFYPKIGPLLGTFFRIKKLKKNQKKMKIDQFGP